MLFIAFVVLYIKETHQGGKTKVTYHFIILFLFCRSLFLFTKSKNQRMGTQISKIEDTIHEVYKKTWPQAW